jgi:polysaccharide export outer membrane protein
LTARISVAALVLALVVLHADIFWAQEKDTGSISAQDCQAHPDAANCQQSEKPSPPAKSETVARSQQPATLSPVPSVTSGPETPTEAAKPVRPLAPRTQSEPQPQPEPPPPPPTEFQIMVADSVGQILPIYGATLFRQPPSTFAPVENVPVPADYMVGPGDELYVRLWGQLNVELRATVDRNGQVFVPKVGAISVAGVRASNLDAYFRQQIERIYRNFELSVTLGKLRSIDVFFVGEGRRPGTYTISSLSTLVNAIFAGGGPAPQGSLRHIQLKRDGQLVTDFDLYDLLLKGDKSKDAPLLAGDVIYIAPVGPQVAIAGSVNTPAIYELRNAQTSLSDAIELAGGLNTMADGSKVTLERIDQHQVRSVAEFPLTQSGQQQMVKDGDIIRVLSIVPRFDNAVTLRGNVANPGRYPWHPGMKIRDLIPNKEVLLTRSYWRSENALVTGTATRYEKPPENRADEARLRTEVKLNAPEINWDYAALQRLNPVDLSTTLIPFSLGKAVLEGDETNNLELRAGDIVTIFSQRDISVPIKRQTMLVRVEGEVRIPGIYKIQQGDTLREILERAGGLTENAYLYGTQFTRETARLEQQAALDRITMEMEAQIEQKSITNTRSSPENALAISAQSASQQALLRQLRAAKANGRVVLQLKPNDNSLAAVPSVVLEDADHVLVPPQGQMVSVVGSVYNQSSFIYRKGATVGDYIRESGGGNATADLRHTLLVRADGSVIGHTSVFKHFGESFASMRVLPGDAIVIPAKLQSGGFSKALRDWVLIASQASIAAAVIAVH